ncbi:Protein SlyX [Pandoraea terrae]|uniref:Protein SlyX n=1 Tax=Pandoraea terrae TaxID=1537710 RepID=A0A5E4UKA6_9BURK|nr:SlyX family protein [Pandoraea terrae]VVE00124.1 Protein SlyX [Pandoraea terrae]
MESRLTELEIKVAFQEDLLDTLNEIVTRQQQQIELLQKQFQALYQQVQSGASAGGAGADADPRHEIPPHY